MMISSWVTLGGGARNLLSSDLVGLARAVMLGECLGFELGTGVFIIYDMFSLDCSKSCSTVVGYQFHMCASSSTTFGKQCFANDVPSVLDTPDRSGCPSISADCTRTGTHRW